MQVDTLRKIRADVTIHLTGKRFCSHCQLGKPADTFHKKVIRKGCTRYICPDCWSRIQAHKVERVK